MNTQTPPPPTIKVFVFSGGTLPVQGRPNEDAGFDVFTRAIVSQDIGENGARKTLWNLISPPPHDIAHHATTIELEGVERWAYCLKPNETVRLGIGVAFGMDNTWHAVLVPRSSTAGKQLQVVAEDTINWYHHVPIDSGFHGEPTALVTNFGAEPIMITKDWRPAQLVFYCECCKGQGFVRPTFHQVSSLTELGKSSRGIASHGSSGTHGKPGTLETQLDLFKAA